MEPREIHRFFFDPVVSPVFKARQMPLGEISKSCFPQSFNLTRLLHSLSQGMQGRTNHPLQHLSLLDILPKDLDQ